VEVRREGGSVGGREEGAEVKRGEGVWGGGEERGGNMGGREEGVEVRREEKKVGKLYKMQH
jgi:hypothetical protein